MWRSFVLVLTLLELPLCRQAPNHQFPDFPRNRVPENQPPFPRKPPLYPTPYDTPDPPDTRYPVLHAGVPRGLAVTSLPLEKGGHELVFNVSWLPSRGPPARDYSLEVTSETKTEDCRSPICYEYDIPGDYLWHLIPKLRNPVAETCAVRPGCAYRVRLIAHPWDGHTSANKDIKLDECVEGVCSCAHSPRLPTPVVKARTLSMQGHIVVNISWTLPPPRFPQRLPPQLAKKLYFVSIGKQMVSDAHPSPWFSRTVSREISVDGPVAIGDDVRWTVVPINERSGGRSGDTDKRQRDIVLDVKLLARVNLVDERGCVGPAGNATAYDPAEVRKIRIGTYALWAAFGGACVLAMVAVLAVSARAVKRVLNAFRPAPVSAPLEPLSRRPAWFPMQLRSYFTPRLEIKSKGKSLLWVLRNLMRFIMESEARGCEVVVSGKLKGQRAKSVKFADGLMIYSGDPCNDYHITRYYNDRKPLIAST